MQTTNQEDESEEAVACCACGASLWPDVDRGFACSPEAYLCFRCAEQRGGVYDGQHDRWVIAPDTSGLVDERRAHP
jgi:hypothetical protein